jgi:two-component system chemotaxis family response regulator WspR
MSTGLILPGEPWPNFSKPHFAILLVDDRPFIAEAIQSLLRDESDISLHYCPDPFQSLEMAERIDPTVILLDVIMQDMDGFTLCRFFRAHPRTRDKPVIMLSGAEEPPAKAQAFAAGANDYLVKLPDKIELIARLRYHSVAYLNKMERDKASAALQTCQMRIEHLHGQVTKLTRHDILTGLSNRSAFEERCNEMWNLAMRNNIPISLIMMNLDCFALFNEHYGHPRGDESITAITQVFRQTIRRLSDVLARFSDEKFIALLPATQAEGAAHLAESVRLGVEKLGIPHSKSGVARHLTISLGVASTTPMRGANVGALLKLSEECLSRSKALGRNRFHVGHLPRD